MTLTRIFESINTKMNDMKKDTYTLWIDDELVATRDHNRDGYNDLLAEASEVQGKAACEIYSSKDDQAVWTSDRETIIEEQAAQADVWWDSLCERLRTQLLRRNLLGDVRWKSSYILPPQA